MTKGLIIACSIQHEKPTNLCKKKEQPMHVEDSNKLSSSKPTTSFLVY
jgi:hypothetical protein